jgi:hypothetical protein
MSRVAWLALVLCAPASAQRPPAETARPTTYGLELAFRSGHADRGFIISDRPVIQPVAWLSARGTDFSVWTNYTLSETTDGARPEILEIELTREHEWKRLTIEPAVRVYFYHDPLSPYSTRSIEGWLHLAFDAGPFSLFTTHSLDVLANQGGYFVDAGIESERSVSDRLEIGGRLGAGWASAMFNDYWVDVGKSALNRISAEGWVTAYVSPHLYIAPAFEFSTLLDRSVRAAAVRPAYLRFGLAVGGEF